MMSGFVLLMSNNSRTYFWSMYYVLIGWKWPSIFFGAMCCPKTLWGLSGCPSRGEKGWWQGSIAIPETAFLLTTQANTLGTLLAQPKAQGVIYVW